MKKKKINTKRRENRRATQHENWKFISRHGRKKYDLLMREGNPPSP